MTEDRIVKETIIKAPIARVFRAITDPKEFGEWFGVRLDASSFELAAHVRGTFTDPKYAHLPFLIVIDRIDAPRYFAYRWHAHEVDLSVDYSGEPMTRVSFELSEVPGGTRLRITEAGFEHIPIARRAQAYRSNTEGWSIQSQNLEQYLAKAG